MIVSRGKKTAIINNMTTIPFSQELEANLKSEDHSQNTDGSRSSVDNFRGKTLGVNERKILKKEDEIPSPN